jgi:arylsulfatase A-like enzyme
VVFSESNGFIAATDGRYKYAHFSRDGQTLTDLYDLEADPHEFHNQARTSAYAEALARMRGAVVGHLIEHSLPDPFK